METWKWFDIKIQGSDFWAEYGLYCSFKKVQPCLRYSRIFQQCTSIKFWFAFCFYCIFQSFILTNRRCALLIALVQWSITNVPSAAANLERHEAQNEVKIYFKLELWTWDETLQEQVVESLCSPALVVVVEQLEGAGKIWADGGQWQEWLPLTQLEQRS